MKYRYAVTLGSSYIANYPTLRQALAARKALTKAMQILNHRLHVRIRPTVIRLTTSSKAGGAR